MKYEAHLEDEMLYEPLPPDGVLDLKLLTFHFGPRSVSSPSFKWFGVVLGTSRKLMEISA